MQAFSDGVFAFAATLLVVSLEVPGSYDDLIDALAGFPALGIAFAAIVSLWAIHREFFSRYPLSDNISMAINAVLLFIVLIYVYPLKLLAEIAARQLLQVGTPTVTDMTPAQVQGVYVIFGLAVLLTCLAIAALHLRAWQLRDVLELDDPARGELTARGWSYIGIGIGACLSIAAAALGLGTTWACRSGCCSWSPLPSRCSSAAATRHRAAARADDGRDPAAPGSHLPNRRRQRDPADLPPDRRGAAARPPRHPAPLRTAASAI